MARLTRAVLLPFTGDCLLLRTWLQSFALWKDEIDTLYVLVNGTIPTEVGISIIKQLEKCQARKVNFEIINQSTDHGPALNMMLAKCQEDLVLLVEEDGFIFKNEQVDMCFSFIESGVVDMVGSSRGSCSREIYEKAEQIWQTPPQAPNFWPNFFFISRENLVKTDRHFQAKAWRKGEYIKELDLTITDDIAPADTFVWTSIQLRAMGYKALLVDQYHSRIEDIQDKDHITGIFDRKAPWVHIGSLSGWHHALFDPLQPRIGDVSEWERRAGAWLMFWEDAQDDLPESLQEFSQQYKAGIDRLITAYTLSPARVKLRADLFRYVINPELYARKQAQLNTI